MRSSLPNISIEKQLHYSEKGEQGGTDIREPSTAILGISSIDRYKTGLTAAQTNPSLATPNLLTSPYDFQITTPAQNLMTGFFTRMAVNEVQFRWTIPTLTARNNKIYINIAPYSNTAVTNIASSGSTFTFTLASTTGYLAGQTIVASGFSPVDVSGTLYEINGVYTIASTTGTTLVCNDPNNIPNFTTTAGTGNVVVRALITIPSGWYDLYNQEGFLTLAAYTDKGVSLTANPTNDKYGNICWVMQDIIRNTTGLTTICDAIVFRYYFQYQGTDNRAQSGVLAAGQPYNCFVASNLSSTGTSPFYFSRYTEPTRPNAVSLFEMMAWNNNQTLRAFQYGSPNASMLSTPFVDICCDGLTYNQALKDGDTGDISRTMLCRLFLTPDAFTGNMANLGSAPILIHRAFPFPKQIRWSPNQPIGNLRFQIYDSQGYLVSTYEGLSGAGTNPPTHWDSDMGDWSMTLLVSEV
jgi:hypothetical protein